MIVKSIEVTILKCELKQGKGKTSGKDYKFYTASLVDEDANVFAVNLADDLVASLGEEGVVTLLEQRNQPATVDIKFSPKGFDIGATLVKIH